MNDQPDDNVPSTCDLCDAHRGDTDGAFRVLPPLFRDFGGRTAFHGPVSSARAINSLPVPFSPLISTDRSARDSRPMARNTSRIDGVSPTRPSSDQSVSAARASRAVRDLAELAACALGIRALAPLPLPTERAGQGLRDVMLDLRGVRVRPGDWLYADADGIVLLPHRAATS